MRAPIDSQGTAQRGRKIAARELKNRGAKNVEEVAAKHRRVITFVSPNGRPLTAIVKASSGVSWQGTITDGEVAKADNQTFWLFLDLQRERDSVVAIVPDAWMRADIHQHHQAYLAKHGGRRRDNNDSKHTAVDETRIAQWRGRWDLLGME